MCVMRSVTVLRIKIIQHIPDRSLTQTESYVDSVFVMFYFSGKVCINFTILCFKIQGFFKNTSAVFIFVTFLLVAQSSN